MAVPKFYEFFRAILVVLRDGELHKMSELRNRIAGDDEYLVLNERIYCTMKR